METRKMIAGMVVVVLVLLSGAAQAKKDARRSDVRVSSITEEKLVLEYAFSEPVVSQKAGYDVVQIGSLESYQRVGAPIVPVRPVYVLVPFGKEVKATNITVLETHELPGVYKLMPGQRSYPYSYEGPIEFTEPDPAIYGSSAPWPGKNGKEVGTQSKRGYQVFIVNLFPLQYQPLEGKVSYATQIRLEIILDVSEKKPVLRPSRRVKAKLKADVDNPDALKTYGTVQVKDKDKGMVMESGGGRMLLGWSPGEANSPLNDPNCPYYGENWNYVVITSPNFADSNNIPDANYSFQALCNSKEARGMPAGIVDTNWIYTNYDASEYDPNNYDAGDPASNNATSIRMFLMDAYQIWGTEYALLGGAIDIIPARMLWADTYVRPTDEMPTDMYYGCVEPSECTFNYDTDDRWGEPTDGIGGGEVDMWAEIYVGRAAVEDANEVVNFVRKTLAYDSTDITSEYLRRIAMVGEYIGWGGVAEYAKDILEQIRLGGTYDNYFTYGFENYEISEFFVTEGCMPGDPNTYWPLYDKDCNWARSDLIDLMNGGVHIVNHLGHGNFQCMAKYKAFCVDYIKSELQNTDYFFGYSQSCDAGQFDESDCFAEEVTAMESGAFAAVMNARWGCGKLYSTDGASQRFNRQFWDAVLGENMLEMGRANQDSKEDNYWDIYGENIRWCYYELNLFGDPELRFHIYPVYNTKQDLYYETIQGAINDANNEDEIVVAPGTYYEAIDFNGVSCTLRGAEPNDWSVVAATIIDANDANANVVTFASGEDANALLKGLTITGGYNGILISDCSPVVKRCILLNNSRGLKFEDNNADPNINNNIIRDNTNEGILASKGNATIKNNLVCNNERGMKLVNASAVIRNNTVIDNTTFGIEKSGGSGTLTISNCIIWDCNDDLQRCSATYSCIEDGDAGTGNISSDPCFMSLPEQGMIAWWKFDEGTGTTAYDSAGNNDGNITGEPNWVTGKAGGYALDFNGVGDYVNVSGLTNPVNMTYALWIKADSLCGGYDTLLEFEDDEPWFGISGGGNIELWTYVTSNHSITIGQWHHLAVTSDGSKSIIYIDGQADAYGSANTDTGTGLGIGYHSGDTPFDGIIDEVMIFNRALSGSEIKALYEKGKIPVRVGRLRENSPCIDAGHPSEPNSTTDERDIDGEARVANGRVDMGADESYYPIAHWKMDDNAANPYVAVMKGEPTELVQDGTFYQGGYWTCGDPWQETGPFGDPPFAAKATDTSYWDGTMSQNIGAVSGNVYSLVFQVKQFLAIGLAARIGGSQMGSSVYSTGWYAFSDDAGSSNSLLQFHAAGYANEKVAIDNIFCICLDDFPNTGTFNDATGNPYTNAHDTAGQIGGALTFDGVDDYINTGSSSNLDNLPLDDMTVSAWIYDEYTSGTTWGTVMGCYASNAGWSLRTFSDANGDRSLYFQAPHSASDYSKWANFWSSDGTITSNTWHHVAAVWDASTKTAKLYIDGEEPSYQQSDPGVGPYNSDASRNKEIGRIPHVGGVQYFNGKIDDVLIYSRGLSSEEIQELYQDGL